MNIKNFFIYIIIIIASFSLSFLSFNYIKHPKQNCVDRYSEGWEAAKKRIQESNVCEMASNNNAIFSMVGEIASIGSKSITLKIKPISPLDDSSLDQREVKIDNKTTIFKYIEKNQDVYNKELADYEKSRDKYANEDEFYANKPSLVEKREATINDFKNGQLVVVNSVENIRTANDFFASDITIQK